MTGTVRSVDFREKKNESLLHIEADEMPLVTKNHILAQVFGLINNEEALPFRIVDEFPAKPDNEPSYVPSVQVPSVKAPVVPVPPVNNGEIPDLRDLT
jgi:hypothetical protein